IILISHDRHLLRNTVDEFILVNEGRVENFDGDLSDYQAWLAQSNNKESKSSKPVKVEIDKKQLRQQAAQRREAMRPLTNAIKKLEKDIQQLTAQLGKIESVLN